MNVREELQSAIRTAAENDDRKRLCTLRLMQAAIRDRDAAHCAGNGEKISSGDIASILRKMIRQREEQVEAEQLAGNNDLVAQTEREIETIREFVPPVMNEPQMRDACAKIVSEIGAAGLRDVGRTVSALKKRYPGQLDIGRASCMVRGMLR